MTTLFCRNCKKAFERQYTSGRPPQYCTRACRNRATAKRRTSTPASTHDTEARTAVDALLESALRIQANVTQFEHLDHASAHDLLKETTALRRDSSRVEQSLIQQLSARGAPRTAIAQGLQLSEKGIRGWFSRPGEQAAAKAEPCTGQIARLPPHGPWGDLVEELNRVFRLSKLSVEEAADAISRKPDRIHQVLAGEGRRPNWVLCQNLYQACGGHAGSLKPMWDELKGERQRFLSQVLPSD